MPATTISPETRLLSAQLRMRDPKAIAKVVSVLKSKKGNVSETVSALGVKRSTWYRWAHEIPEVAKAIDEHSRGRGNTNLIMFKGKLTPLGKVAKALRLKRTTLNMRLINGVPLERALTSGALRTEAAPAKKKRAAGRKRKNAATS